MEVRIVSAGDIAKCPAGSLLPSHYDDNGNCECKNSEYTVKWEIELIADDPEQEEAEQDAVMKYKARVREGG